MNNFLQRLFSSMVLAPLVLAIVYLGGPIYACFVILVLSLGLSEWLRIVDPQARATVVCFAYAALLLTMLMGVLTSPVLGAFLGTALLLVLFLLAVRDHAERAGWIVLGLPYMAGFGLALLYLRMPAGSIGMAQLYYLLAVVWGTDIGAYIAGRLIGGPKLAPAISPSKTWAGLFGGMVLASLLGYSIAELFKAREPFVAAGFGIVMAVVSQLGDLFESYIKRRSGLKESGALIPGHGGVLDRIDGLIFAAIFYVLFQAGVGTDQQWW